MNTDFMRRVLSVAETGKEKWPAGEVFYYADGPGGKVQCTLSIGFTASGNLLPVLVHYIGRNGKHADKFHKFVTLLKKGDLLPRNAEFTAACKTAAADPLFMTVQEEDFTEFYMKPAFKWARENGFVLGLSYLVIADSFLHSGSMLGFLMNRFPEKKPAAGGDEKKWIESYLRARREWLASHPQKILNATIYRANAYLSSLAKGDWNLEQPIVMHGTVIKPNIA
jgi:chitosanase